MVLSRKSFPQEVDVKEGGWMEIFWEQRVGISIMYYLNKFGFKWQSLRKFQNKFGRRKLVQTNLKASLRFLAPFKESFHAKLFVWKEEVYHQKFS